MPTRLDIVCHDDGSTTRLNDEVEAASDGVHIRVDNRAGESVSLNGTGLDFATGVTEQVSRVEPGRIDIACWPGSMHSGPEPSRFPVQIHDPHDHWSEAKLECAGDDLIVNATLDYADGAPGSSGDPEELARDKLEGIEPDDEIVTVGYPDADYRDVAVQHDGRTVAIAGFSPADQGGWLLGGYSACPSAGIKP